MGEYEYYYEDPKVTTANITDVYDSSLNYTVLKYATLVQNNNFTGNYAGMKGSAMAVSELNELHILNNTFAKNGPVTTFSEIEHSPYYKYLAHGARTLTLNLPTFCFVNYTNEFDYIENCVLGAFYYIDMPSILGALYVEHCLDDYFCHIPVSSSYIQQHYLSGGTKEAYAQILDDFSQLHQVSKQHVRAEI